MLNKLIAVLITLAIDPTPLPVTRQYWLPTQLMTEYGQPK